MSTGSSCPSILTDMVNRSFNRPYQTLSGLSTNRSTPGGRVKTKSSRLYPWYVLLGKGQHCRRWWPSWILWPICNVPKMRMCPSPCIAVWSWRTDYTLDSIMTYYYVLFHIIITVRRRSKRPISTGRNMECTSNRLRSDGSSGNCRLGKSSPRNSWRKLAIFLGR